MLKNIALVGAVICLSAFLTIHHAWQAQEQFFPTTIYLMRSPLSVAVLTCFALYLMFLLALILKTLLFGKLRIIEAEHVQEYGWLTLSESFLAMTIFRDEFDARFVLIFSAVMMIKSFHWIARDRVDYMEQTPALSSFFHLRMVATSLLLAIADLTGFGICIMEVIKNGPSMAILFGNEFALLLLSLTSVTVRYGLNARDLRHGSVWEHRSIFLFYYEFLVDSFKLLIYGAFFTIVVMYYGIPLHIIRDLYLTIRSFFLRVRDIVRYRRATANMEERYPEASAEELAGTDRICIICREEMISARKLPCGHLFHFRCLRSWLERQQACPTCRRSIIDEQPARPPNPPTPPPAAPSARSGTPTLAPSPEGTTTALPTPLIWANGRWQRMGRRRTEGEQAPEAEVDDEGEGMPLNPELRRDGPPIAANNNGPALVFPQLSPTPIPPTPVGQIPGTVIPSPFGTIPVILIPPEHIAPLAEAPPAGPVAVPPTRILPQHLPRPVDELAGPSNAGVGITSPTQEAVTGQTSPQGCFPTNESSLGTEGTMTSSLNEMTARKENIKARLQQEVSSLTKLQSDLADLTQILIQSQHSLDEQLESNDDLEMADDQNSSNAAEKVDEQSNLIEKKDTS